MLALKIDVSRIDKARLFKGEKGTYLDCVLIETPDNKHSDSHMIVQSVSKEERLAGKKGPIIGNAKEIGGGKTKPAPRSDNPPPRDEEAVESEDQTIPF